MFPLSVKSRVKWFWKLLFLTGFIACNSYSVFPRDIIPDPNHSVTTLTWRQITVATLSPPFCVIFSCPIMMTGRFDFGADAGSRPTMEWKIDVFVMNYVVTWRIWVHTHWVHKIVVWVPDVPEQSCVVCYISWVRILAHNPAVMKVL
jgi:hypothetical protein